MALIYNLDKKTLEQMTQDLAKKHGKPEFVSAASGEETV